MPTRREIDRRLVGGAAIFGIGWGLAGYCPGPGIVSLGSGLASAAVFVLAMLVGIGAHEQLAAARFRFGPAGHADA